MLSSSFIGQAKVDATYKDKAKWTKMSIMSTAGSAKFSSDRTIQEYADDIWQVMPSLSRSYIMPIHAPNPRHDTVGYPWTPCDELTIMSVITG